MLKSLAFEQTLLAGIKRGDERKDPAHLKPMVFVCIGCAWCSTLNFTAVFAALPRSVIHVCSFCLPPLPQLKQVEACQASIARVRKCIADGQHIQALSILQVCSGFCCFSASVLPFPLLRFGIGAAWVSRALNGFRTSRARPRTAYPSRRYRRRSAVL